MGQRDEIIRILEESSRPLSDAEIADQMDVTTSGMWQARKNLLDDGVIEAIGSNPQIWTLTENPHDIDNLDESASQPQKSKANLRLERNLEKYMFDNLENLESGLRTIGDGDSQQRKVDSGILDILAEDKQGNPVVLELKAGEAEHDALGQIMSYMADINNEFQSNDVRGMIVAESFSKQLSNAASIQENIQLHQYHVQFSFERTDN